MANKPTIHDLREQLAELSREDELEQRLRDIELEKAEERGWKRGVAHFHKFCITLGLSIMAGAYKVGDWLYQHYLPVQAGIDTMIDHILKGNK